MIWRIFDWPLIWRHAFIGHGIGNGSGILTAIVKMSGSNVCPLKTKVKTEI
jgi:hypothetical protein